jgi:hypothetical protein
MTERDAKMMLELADELDGMFIPEDEFLGFALTADTRGLIVAALRAAAAAPVAEKERWLKRARATQCCDPVIDGIIGSAIEIIAAPVAVEEIKFGYTNWENRTSHRRVRPISIPSRGIRNDKT